MQWKIEVGFIETEKKTKFTVHSKDETMIRAAFWDTISGSPLSESLLILSSNSSLHKNLEGNLAFYWQQLQ